ncbi:hypothetical protein B0H34DRAFT_547774 [Crassisporium funariophilum]|nr:hypothetical protein B0H34DRAFT_547774 [Crassisporium funariophilum]
MGLRDERIAWRRKLEKGCVRHSFTYIFPAFSNLCTYPPTPQLVPSRPIIPQTAHFPTPQPLSVASCPPTSFCPSMARFSCPSILFSPLFLIILFLSFFVNTSLPCPPLLSIH